MNKCCKANEILYFIRIGAKQITLIIFKKCDFRNFITSTYLLYLKMGGKPSICY